MIKTILIFDLDQTLVCSKHRTPNNPDGTLNLKAFFASRNRDSIFKDSLLPLYKYFIQAINNPNYYVVICTARTMINADWEFLAHYDINPDKILYRGNKTPGKYKNTNDVGYKSYSLHFLFTLKQFKNKPKFLFDDALPILSFFRKKEGITCLNAITINKKLK